MMLNTARFGEIDIEEEKAITFVQGVPGFEQWTKYIILQPNLEVPFAFLQCVEEPDLSFVIANPFLFYSDYGVDLSDSLLEELRIEDEQDVMLWSIVSITEKIQDATMNLLAPLVVNSKAKMAKQIILHQTNYKTKHKLLTEPETESVPKEG